MFCPNCGKELPDGAKFCSGCGMQTSPEAAAAETSELSGTQEPLESPKPPAAEPGEMNLDEYYTEEERRSEPQKSKKHLHTGLVTRSFLTVSRST